MKLDVKKLGKHMLIYLAEHLLAKFTFLFCIGEIVLNFI
jgi:hypothetical protein